MAPLSPLTGFQRRQFSVPTAAPPPGMALWLKADSLSLSNGASIARWADSSGNGNDATQATTASQPTFITNVQNGLPVVRFDGSSDYFNSPLALSGDNLCIFIVCKGSNLQSLVRWQNAGGFLVYPYSTAPYKAINSNDGFINGPNAGLSNNVWQMGVFHYYRNTAGGFATYRDGVAVETRNAANSALPSIASLTIGNVLVGDAEYFMGDAAEIIIYESAQTTMKKQQTEAYIKNKWGTP